jgi:hypothetical protein
MAEPGRDAVVFDLGDVLLDWSPRHLYRKLFPGDKEAMEHFLATVCTTEWHRHHDAGRSYAEGSTVPAKEPLNNTVTPTAATTDQPRRIRRVLAAVSAPSNQHEPAETSTAVTASPAEAANVPASAAANIPASHAARIRTWI